MSAAATLIAQMRIRQIKVADISDEDLTALMTALLPEYSRYMPIYGIKTFDTVEDQAEYTWTEIGDADGIDLVQCIWNGLGAVDSEWRALTSHYGIHEFIFGETDYHHPSQEIVERLKLLAWERFAAGSAHQYSPAGNIFLDPTPTESGLKVLVLYTKYHSALADIPAIEDDIFLDLVESHASRIVTKNLAASAVATKFKTPDYEIDMNAQIGFWRKNTTEMFDSFVRKANAGKAAAGRS